MVDSQRIQDIHSTLMGDEADTFVPGTPNARTILKHLLDINQSLGLSVEKEDEEEKITTTRSNTPYPNFPTKAEVEDGTFEK